MADDNTLSAAAGIAAGVSAEPSPTIDPAILADTIAAALEQIAVQGGALAGCVDAINARLAEQLNYNRAEIRRVTKRIQAHVRQTIAGMDANTRPVVNRLETAQESARAENRIRLMDLYGRLTGEQPQQFDPYTGQTTGPAGSPLSPGVLSGNDSEPGPDTRTGAGGFEPSPPSPVFGTTGPDRLGMGPVIGGPVGADSGPDASGEPVLSGPVVIAGPAPSLPLGSAADEGGPAFVGPVAPVGLDLSIPVSGPRPAPDVAAPLPGPIADRPALPTVGPDAEPGPLPEVAAPAPTRTAAEMTGGGTSGGLVGVCCPDPFKEPAIFWGPHVSQETRNAVFASLGLTRFVNCPNAYEAARIQLGIIGPYRRTGQQ